MNKIGIVTTYKNPNYGSSLQSYALQRVIRDLGYECENLRIELTNKTIYSQAKAIAKNPSKLFQNKVRAGKYTRLKYVLQFVHQYLHESSSVYTSLEDLKKANKEFEAFVCGSDQIWAPNQFREYFFLSFAEGDHRKIAYAPSIGLPQVPQHLVRRMGTLLKGIQHLSIREEQGAEIIRDLAHKNAPVVLDPTLLLDSGKWSELKTQRQVEGDYILCYFLGINHRHRKIVEEYKIKTGMKIVSLPFARRGDYSWGDVMLAEIGPIEFIDLIKNAKIIFTDSYHGSIFSILFNKPFYTFMRFQKGDALCQNSRIANLFSMFGLTHRLLDSSVPEIKDTTNIDYALVNSLVEEKRKKSIEYLKNSIESSIAWSERHHAQTVDAIKNNECTGCGTCENVCPQKCIRLESNREGFIRPVIDKDRCTTCGICLRVCPVVSGKSGSAASEPPRIYAAQNQSQSVLRNSTSGGVFYSLAEEILKNNGVVFGAAFDENMLLRHMVVCDIQELGKLQGSKYIQSYTGDTYSRIASYLIQGRAVLFSGLPCQVGGLNAFLKYKKVISDNLTTCQLLCFGVPSNLLFDEYVNILEKKYNSKIISYYFRVKKLGWKRYGVMAIFENGKQYVSKGSNDPFIIGFKKALYLRESCYTCKFKGFPIQADIALGDFWHLDQTDTAFPAQGGISLVIVQTPKGEGLLQASRNNLLVKEKSLETAIQCNLSIVKSAMQSQSRTRYYNDYYARGYRYCRKKYTSSPNIVLRIVRKFIRMTRDLF